MKAGFKDEYIHGIKKKDSKMKKISAWIISKSGLNFEFQKYQLWY